MTDATPPTTPCMPIIHTHPGSSSLRLCHRSRGVEGVVQKWGGARCPLSLLTLGPLGAGWRSCEFQSASAAFISESEMWITLDSYRWRWRRARIPIKGDRSKAPWIAGQTQKIDMPIMSEVGRSSLAAFKSLGKWRQLPLYRVLPCLLSLNLSPPPPPPFFFLKIFQSLSSRMATASSFWALWD